ncbi:MAG TPA: DUF6580 family putative transport protein [Acidisarcina sp.]
MVSYLLVMFAVASHVLPHAWISFTAVGGSLLYFGARRPLGQAVLPVAALMVSDYYLTVHVYNYPFAVSFYLLTWLWYAAVIVLGKVLLGKRTSIGRVAIGVLASSTSFFLLSNFAAWATPGMYVHNATGLMTCYAAALPFYRNDLLSTALVAGLVFSFPFLQKQLAGWNESSGVRPA